VTAVYVMRNCEEETTLTKFRLEFNLLKPTSYVMHRQV
jgi:hypothetical protein